MECILSMCISIPPFYTPLTLTAVRLAFCKLIACADVFIAVITAQHGAHTRTRHSVDTLLKLFNVPGVEVIFVPGMGSPSIASAILIAPAVPVDGTAMSPLKEIS
jgi:hypothetical protein